MGSCKIAILSCFQATQHAKGEAQRDFSFLRTHCDSWASDKKYYSEKLIALKEILISFQETSTATH